MKLKEKIYPLIEMGIKAATSLLPGPFSAVFDVVFDNVKESTLAKRAEQWKKEVITRLENLEMEYDALINNDTFATSLIKTSEMAIKTESDEKGAILASPARGGAERSEAEGSTFIVT